jgi:hypothetical protein
VDGVGVLFPAEHAYRGDAVEGDIAQRGEGLVPGDVASLALAYSIMVRMSPAPSDKWNACGMQKQ